MGKVRAEQKNQGVDRVNGSEVVSRNVRKNNGGQGDALATGSTPQLQPANSSRASLLSAAALAETRATPVVPYFGAQIIPATAR